MGKFDGILICSDVDGTFDCGNSIQGNSAAVKYFTENGGKFTFATGRSVEYLLDPKFFNNINAPACLYNGGVVYDYAEKKILRRINTSFTVADFARFVASVKFNISAVHMYCGDAVSGDMVRMEELLKAHGHLHPIKVVCVFEDAETTKDFCCYARELKPFDNTYISRSWNTGLEFNSADGTKGHAIRFIKEHMGNIHTAIGIGDGENDETLLESADIGVAVANAASGVKKRADMVVCHAGECAIRDLINILDKRYS